MSATRMLLFSLLVMVLLQGTNMKEAAARDLNYTGGEAKIYVVPGEPTVVSFSHEIEGGFKTTSTSLDLHRRGTDLVVLARPELPPEGEVVVVYLKNGKPFMLRFLPASQ